MPRHLLIESSPRPISEQAEQAICQALYAGDKIGAIKEHRAATGAGLAESKEFIDVLDRQLRAETPELFVARKGMGCAGVIVLSVVTGLAAMTIL